MKNAVRGIAIAAVSASIAAGAAYANDAAVKARQGQFALYAFNLGPLAGMAQGQVPYDATVAQAAADNLVHLTSLDQSRHWPEGTDSMSIDGTRALPAIWDDLDDFAAKFEALQTAALAMQAAAGTDLAALQAALGPLGGACQACHQANRAPQ